MRLTNILAWNPLFIPPSVSLDQSCRLMEKPKSVNIVTTCMLSAFCHGSAPLGGFGYGARVSLVSHQNKRIFQASGKTARTKARDEHRDQYRLQNCSLNCQTVSHSFLSHPAWHRYHRDKHLAPLSSKVSTVPTSFNGVLRPGSPAHYVRTTVTSHLL